MCGIHGNNNVFFLFFILRNSDTKFEALELFGVTSLVEHPAQMSPPGKSIGGKMCKLKEILSYKIIINC